MAFIGPERPKLKHEDYLSMYIKSKLAKVSNENGLKESKSFSNYVAERNEFTGMLPNITNPNKKTTFRVLLDGTIKVPRYDIIVMVSSFALHFARRSNSRKTWANVSQSVNKNW